MNLCGTVLISFSYSKHIPKTTIQHPGNNIQLKLKGNKLIQELNHVELAAYKI